MLRKTAADTTDGVCTITRLRTTNYTGAHDAYHTTYLVRQEQVPGYDVAGPALPRPNPRLPQQAQGRRCATSTAPQRGHRAGHRGRPAPVRHSRHGAGGARAPLRQQPRKSLVAAFNESIAASLRRSTTICLGQTWAVRYNPRHHRRSNQGVRRWSFAAVHEDDAEKRPFPEHGHRAVEGLSLRARKLLFLQIAV